MSVENGLSRFSKEQCCGTCTIRYLGDGAYCLVSSNCDGECKCGSFPVDCVDFAGLEIGDEIDVYCRNDCGYSGEVHEYADCGGGGGGGCPDECPEGTSGCSHPGCIWTWVNFAHDWISSVCPPEADETPCTCSCKPDRDGDFNGETVDGLCCK